MDIALIPLIPTAYEVLRILRKINLIRKNVNIGLAPQQIFFKKLVPTVYRIPKIYKKKIWSERVLLLALHLNSFSSRSLSPLFMESQNINNDQF